MAPEVSIFVAMVMACQIAVYTDARPEKAFAKGYSGRNLPPGKWTRWFDASHTGAVGDYETVENVVREFGRGCDGLPCRHPLAVKAISVYGLTPSEHNDKVHLHARTGLICRHDEQADGKCMDYKVRFYCPYSQTNCNRKSQVNELTEEQKRMKHAKLQAKEHTVKHHNEANNYFKSDDKLVFEMPKYSLKYPRVILPNLRGALAQMPDYKDAMTSHNKDGVEQSDSDVQLSYFRDPAPRHSATSDSVRIRTDMKDSAPSVNTRGKSNPLNHVRTHGEDGSIFRHFPKNPRAPFG